jgi:hypothetical protein
MSEAVNHPQHYTSHKSGVECVDIAEHLGFCLGNALKYLWRSGKKGPADEDVRKAVWYLRRYMQSRERICEDPGMLWPVVASIQKVLDVEGRNSPLGLMLAWLCGDSPGLQELIARLEQSIAGIGGVKP